jgi:hypothetical protein
MAELREGSKVLVIGAFTEKGAVNIGKSATLSFFASHGDVYKGPDGIDYLCSSDGLPAVIVGSQIYNVVTKKLGWAQVSARHLMVIDGDDFQHEDERQKELTYG